MSNLSQVLKERRKSLGLTLAQIADQVGVTEATVQRWESGNIKSVRPEKIAKLSEILQVSPASLMGIGDNSILEAVANATGNKVLMAYSEWLRAPNPDNPYFTLPEDVMNEIYGENKPTIPEDDGLTENQRLLMQFARTVPDDKADMILRVMKSIVEAD